MKPYTHWYHDAMLMALLGALLLIGALLWTLICTIFGVSYAQLQGSANMR